MLTIQFLTQVRKYNNGAIEGTGLVAHDTVVGWMVPAISKDCTAFILKDHVE